MSSNPLVKIPFPCDRDGKMYDTDVSLTEAQALMEGFAQKTALAAHLKNELEKLEQTPDLIVVFKGKVHVLGNIHESNDLTIGRCLNQALKQDVFPVAEPRKRKTKDEKAADAAAEAEAAEA